MGLGQELELRLDLKFYSYWCILVNQTFPSPGTEFTNQQQDVLQL